MDLNKPQFWNQEAIPHSTEDDAPEELKRYRNKKIISQIYLVKDFSLINSDEGPLNDAITITELEDKIEVFRYNLDYPQDSLDSLFNSRFYNLDHPELSPIICSGIMPKKEYDNLFDYLEQKKDWETVGYDTFFLENSINELLISKNQKKHIIATNSIYSLLFLEMFSEAFKIDISNRAELSESEKEVALRFLDMSKEIYSVSKKYVKIKPQQP